jgi:hypothetical protein
VDPRILLELRAGASPGDRVLIFKSLSAEIDAQRKRRLVERAPVMAERTAALEAEAIKPAA